MRSNSKLNCDCCTLTGSALQADFCFMVSRCVLDDGKAKTGTAGCFRVALVHPIEPFKNPVLVFCRNANTGITDNQTVVFCVDRYTAAWNIVLDGIVAEIIDLMLLILTSKFLYSTR